MGKIVLGLDMDGVLYDFHSALFTYYQYEMNYTGSYEEFWKDFIPSMNPEYQNYIMSIPMLYDMLNPMFGAKEFLEFAKDKAEIYYITHRPVELERLTKRYLKRYDFPQFDNLIMTGDKVTACRLYGVTHFLDDFANQVENVSAVADAYLRARIHNREYQDKLKTVYSLKEFKELVFV
jgi:uncharacterized HAD superfamily protein